MVSQYGLELAVQLITAHFGDVVAKVCKCLLQRGTMSMQELIQFTGLQPAQLKNCLLVLIQHNCVQTFVIEVPGAAGAPPKTVYQYMALFDNILHRMRFPKFLAIVAEHFDKQCEALFEGLLQHGRLSLDQIIDRGTQQGNQGRNDDHQENFIKLVNARFVERCPKSQPFIESNTESEQPKRRGAKAGPVQTLEQRALEIAAPSDTERFSVMGCVGDDRNLDEKAEQSSSIQIGRKRKNDALEMDDGSATAIGKKEVLWRANFAEFVRCLRNKACVANVRSRLDVKTGTVLEAILEASRNEETKVKGEMSVPLSMSTILEEVRRRPGGLEMTVEHVTAALQKLHCLSLEDKYSIDLKSIIEMAQNDEVESIILKRYGREAYRIFRFLAKKGCLYETDRIAGSTLVEKKEANKILFRLWKDEYLQMEKIALAVPGQTQYALWKVNKGAVKERVLDEMNHAILNVNQRLAYELEQEHEFLKLPRDVKNEAQEKRIRRIMKIRKMLEGSLLKLDDALMLFHDF